MYKKLLAVLLTVIFAFSLWGNSFAETLDTVNICVGKSASDSYYSTGGYIGSAKAANPAIVKAEPVSTSLTISGGFYYGTTISFTGLAAGTTTVTFYSQRGGWMGSVTVKVSNHIWEKDSSFVFQATDNAEQPYVLSEYAITKKCANCGLDESENCKTDNSTLGLNLLTGFEDLRYGKSYDVMIQIKDRLKGLGYFNEEADRKLDVATTTAMAKFKKNIGADTRGIDISAELQEILFSTAAPQSDYVPAVERSTYEALEKGKAGDNVQALQARLVELGYMSEISGKYDSATSYAVMLLKMKLGYRLVNDSISVALQSLLFAGETEKLSINQTEYEMLSAIIDGASAGLLPSHLVEITTGSNVRSKPSYDGSKMVWVNPGDRFEYLGEENGWYMITMPDGSIGYVPQDRSKVVEE